MKLKSMVSNEADRNGRACLCGVMVFVWMTTLFLALSVVQAGGASGGSGGKSTEVKFETIPGSTAKRIILTAKAAERLGIETGEVSEKPIVLRQMVSGLLIPPVKKLPEVKPASGVFGGFQKIASSSSMQSAPQPLMVPPSGDVWVLVALSRAEWDRLAKDEPVRLFSLDTRESLQQEIWAKPSGLPPIDDMKRAMLRVLYVLPDKNHGLAVNMRMRVELPVIGSDEIYKVVPYSAIYYDGKGIAWVYVNTKPLTYERQQVGVKRVVDDLAVLSYGPPLGTKVVTVGAAMLWGTEVFGK